MIIFGFAITFCVAAFFLCRWYVLREFNGIDAVLDSILARTQNRAMGEYRISKLAHKANRIMDMYISEAGRAEADKELFHSFISDMSHQMKTPLAGIAMYTELLLEGNATPQEQLEFLTRIKSGTDSLQWMMDGLIKMSVIEAGAIRLSPTSQDIKQTITDSIGGVLAAASKKNIEITAENLETHLLRHDRRWTKEAIGNILENAVKYSHENGEIRISLEKLPLHTKIIITNSGVGIEKSDYNLIFKRFYRGKNVQSTEGAGLGLYIVKLIMEKQGGYIMVESVVGEFTAFSLFLQNC